MQSVNNIPYPKFRNRFVISILNEATNQPIYIAKDINQHVVATSGIIQTKNELADYPVIEVQFQDDANGMLSLMLQHLYTYQSFILKLDNLDGDSMVLDSYVFNGTAIRSIHHDGLDYADGGICHKLVEFIYDDVTYKGIAHYTF